MLAIKRTTSGICSHKEMFSLNQVRRLKKMFVIFKNHFFAVDYKKIYLLKKN